MEDESMVDSLLDGSLHENSAMAAEGNDTDSPATSSGNPCQCKSTCSRKRVSETSARGCPCKSDNRHCSSACKCGTRTKPCKNKPNTLAAQANAETGASQPARPSEDEERKNANLEVKEFIETLDSQMIKKLCTRSLQRGVGSMDYVDSLLIMEDDDDNNSIDDTNPAAAADAAPLLGANAPGGPHQPATVAAVRIRPAMEPLPECCRCGNCRTMPREIENQCCKNKDCVATKAIFAKLCLDPDVLELCIKNSSDIRNDREINNTRRFRKAAYRQYILDKYGY